MRPGPPEERKDKRIDVALPVFLENATGVTRDVSASGVFLWISGMYAYGESISFSMGRKTESGKFMLKCRGDIVRTEWRDDTVGVAVRLIKTAMEPMPSHLSATDALRSAREQPRNINQRWDKALASAIETVDRWSSLLRDKALEAFKQRRGETTLKWDFPSIAVATNPHSRRVTVCSVTVVCLFPKASLALGRSGIRG
ncbi:MAG: PilZ domain-containing protein, partial [Gammaproteobacteria bacterium]|nr:PilZ domain-containing protein [Gammaproteobacteria bacterium]